MGRRFPRTCSRRSGTTSGSGTVSRAYYLNDGSRFILQYKAWGRSQGNATLDFEVILYPNGRIVYQYLGMVGTLDNESIGIQNATRLDGLSVAFRAAYLHKQMAIEFTTPDWLTVTPANATIPPGGNVVFDVKLDSTGRIGGVLDGAIVLTNNLPETRRIPTSLTVLGVPIAGIVPPSLDFGTRFAGYPHLTTIWVVNTGIETLNVLDVTTNDASLTVSEPATGDVFAHAAFSLPPGGLRLFNLRWLPTSPGALPADAAVQVVSDDPVNPTKTMPVSGTAILPPIAAWTPPSFFDSVLSGDAVHHLLHLENQGAGDLTYTANINPPVGWLGVTPQAGTIPAGGFHDLGVDVHSSGLIGGDYTAYVNVTTNDPAHGVFQVPVSLHVTGMPHIAAAPTALTFPMTFPGNSRTLPLAIQNTGTDVLHITSVSVSGDFSRTGSTPPVSIPAHGSIPMTVRFSPLSPGTHHGQLTITSDDPDMGSFVIPLDGTSLSPAVIGVDPASIAEILPPGGTSARELSICNTGGSDLNWSGSTRRPLGRGRGSPLGTRPREGRARSDARHPRQRRARHLWLSLEGLRRAGRPGVQLGRHLDDRDRDQLPAERRQSRRPHPARDDVQVLRERLHHDQRLDERLAELHQHHPERRPLPEGPAAPDGWDTVSREHARAVLGRPPDGGRQQGLLLQRRQPIHPAVPGPGDVSIPRGASTSS